MLIICNELTCGMVWDLVNLVQVWHQMLGATPDTPWLIVVEGIVRVSKGSCSMATLGLPTLYKDGEQMLEVTRVINTSTLVMIHESKC